MLDVKYVNKKKEREKDRDRDGKTTPRRTERNGENWKEDTVMSRLPLTRQSDKQRNIEILMV